ncbi:MAG TPA: NlpC/P60 family protein [Chitinophagaceae bacterium]|jgi:lipoprotein Spr
MLKRILPAFTLALLMVSCSGIKPLAFTNNKSATTSDNNNQKDVKFLDISPADNDDKETKSSIKEERTSKPIATVTTEPKNEEAESRLSGSKKASSLQLKYSQLLNTDVDQIQNLSLYQTIDDWYGTRYQLGGTTKSGIDCSAFVQTVFASVFGVNLPRMARDQYKATRRISRTELQEGDLLFFNTRGGVSHVGIYLQNNKFVHASVSGVMISDMFEPYYVKHFISAGRVNGVSTASSSSLRP